MEPLPQLGPLVTGGVRAACIRERHSFALEAARLPLELPRAHNDARSGRERRRGRGRTPGLRADRVVGVLKAGRKATLAIWVKREATTPRVKLILFVDNTCACFFFRPTAKESSVQHDK